MISSLHSKLSSTVAKITAPLVIVQSACFCTNAGFSIQRYKHETYYHVKKRHKRAFTTVITRSISLATTFTPPVSLPPDHDVIRSSKKKEYILLENQGLLDVTVKFNISDRKGKGAASGKRQLSLLYKNELNYFKKILNSFLGKGLMLPLDKGNYLQLANIKQVLKGSINNLPLEIVVTPQDFLDRSPGGPAAEEQDVPGSVADDLGDAYLKVVTHKFIYAYNEKVDGILKNNPVPTGTRFSNVNDDMVIDDGVSPVVEKITNQKFEPLSIYDSSGIFAIEPGSNVFRNGPLTITTVDSEGEIVGDDDQGRMIFSDQPITLPFPIEGLTNSGIPYHFNAFTKLPLDIRFLELTEFKCSIAGAGIDRNLLNRVSRRARAIVEKKRDTPSETPLEFESSSEFLLPYGFYQYARNQRVNNENSKTGKEHVLSIESRKTLYTVHSGNSLESKTMLDGNFIFEYFEDRKRYERCYVSSTYLGASLHNALLGKIRQTHSNQILYNSIKYNIYAGKAWTEGNGSITKKNPMVSIGTIETPFKPMITGLHQSETINQNLNLVFTSRFAPSTQNIYYTNRFISCSAYSNQAELTTREARELWDQLERGYSEDIILSYYPLVRLVPAFSRGSVVQTSNEVNFRGAVSNSGSSEPFSF